MELQNCNYHLPSNLLPHCLASTEAVPLYNFTEQTALMNIKVIQRFRDAWFRYQPIQPQQMLVHNFIIYVKLQHLLIITCARSTDASIMYCSMLYWRRESSSARWMVDQSRDLETIFAAHTVIDIKLQQMSLGLRFFLGHSFVSLKFEFDLTDFCFTTK